MVGHWLKDCYYLFPNLGHWPDCQLIIQCRRSFQTYALKYVYIFLVFVCFENLLAHFLVFSYRKELYDDSKSLNSAGCWERRKMLPAKFILDGLLGGVSRGMRSSIIKGNILLRDMFTTHSTNSFLSENDLINFTLDNQAFVRGIVFKLPCPRLLKISHSNSIMTALVGWF